MMRIRASRDDRGAATTEYAGILVLVALIVTGLLVFVTPVSRGIYTVAGNAICHIAEAGGLGGCQRPEPPINYEPPDCMMSSEAASVGGSVTFVVTIGGDADYDLQWVRHRDEKGHWSNSYLLTTKRTGKLAYKPGAGGGISKGEEEAAAGGKVEIEVSGAKGTTYKFDSLEDAEKGVDAWKSQNDKNFFVTHPITGEQVSESVFGGAKVTAKGKAGKNSGEISAGVVVGVTKTSTGDTSVNVTMSVSAAAKLGIPLPEGVGVEASGGADVSGDVGVTATWDKNGNLVGLSSLLVRTVQVKGEIGIDASGAKGSTVGGVTVDKVSLPPVAEIAGGVQVRFEAKTSFRNPDGTVDTAAVAAFDTALKRFVTQGQLPTPVERAALYDQMNRRSTVTADFYKYDKSAPKWGAEARLGPFAVGAEVHSSETGREIIQGNYYDFATGTWNERVGCNAT